MRSLAAITTRIGFPGSLCARQVTNFLNREPTLI
jgi:hypothetical protein